MWSSNWFFSFGERKFAHPVSNHSYPRELFGCLSLFDEEVEAEEDTKVFPFFKTRLTLKYTSKNTFNIPSWSCSRIFQRPKLMSYCMFSLWRVFKEPDANDSDPTEEEDAKVKCCFTRLTFVLTSAFSVFILSYAVPSLLPFLCGELVRENLPMQFLCRWFVLSQGVSVSAIPNQWATTPLWLNNTFTGPHIK